MINAYRNAIRTLLEQRRNQSDVRRIIVWDVQPDEAKDPTLLSLRAYGTRMHVDVVLVACGVSGIWELLPVQRIILPLISDVIALRKTYMSDEI
ncbi:hypothetical protein GCM10023206_07000 [Acinetobacter puyangensis]|uniref:Uncharacterized protein n=1 Tax=Acinetobacter puyangensis TaxID=1096779 RepID=A0A240E8L1_9GAMM|nr:hypothetical protein [Acinetobacter puyangensis]SNX44220.1 hypothetical protein SAMN05421731_102381 [Acinetobacter puyangensis]